MAWVVSREANSCTTKSILECNIRVRISLYKLRIPQILRAGPAGRALAEELRFRNRVLTF